MPITSHATEPMNGRVAQPRPKSREMRPGPVRMIAAAASARNNSNSMPPAGVVGVGGEEPHAAGKSRLVGRCHQHHAEHGRAGDRCQQTEHQHQPADGLGERAEDRERFGGIGVEADRGVRRVDQVILEPGQARPVPPPEQLLAAVRHRDQTDAEPEQRAARDRACRDAPGPRSPADQPVLVRPDRAVAKVIVVVITRLRAVLTVEVVAVDRPRPGSASSSSTAVHRPSPVVATTSVSRSAISAGTGSFDWRLRMVGICSVSSSSASASEKPARSEKRGLGTARSRTPRCPLSFVARAGRVPASGATRSVRWVRRMGSTLGRRDLVRSHRRP